MDTLAVKKIIGNEILQFYSILVECGKFMYEKYGLTHWFPFINLDNFLQSIETKNCYGVYQNDVPVATFNLSKVPRDYYYSALWSNPNDSALYLGQLGINPLLQGKGFGKWCMNAIENITLNEGLNTIRFDALNEHPWLKNFYTKLDYKPLEIVKPKNWELLCFEKVLAI